MEKITVLIVDDHKLVIDGISALLAKEKDIKVVGEALTGAEAIIKAQACKPDIVLMDIFIPDLNGIDATQQIKKYVPSTEVIILSMYEDGQFVEKALTAGAKGYLLKGNDYAQLLTAIRTVYNGKSYLSPSLSDVVIDMFKEPKKGAPKYKPIKLSSRERQVLQLIAEGYKTKQIAKKLFLAEKTVANHRINIMNKLSIHDVAGLTRYAIAEGLVSKEQRLRKRNQV